jgi:hypothetical protein
VENRKANWLRVKSTQLVIRNAYIYGVLHVSAFLKVIFRQCNTILRTISMYAATFLFEMLIHVTFWYLMFYVFVSVDGTSVITCDVLGENHPVMPLLSLTNTYIHH